ncbi:MAG TPA: hypothetical protein PLD40_03995 [Kiritimatiellia bacterium]|jgi:hypothetical protein|nr:hypothetical protein [Kiritimatiellia bacterium]OQC60018.1 MAG: hypothetical protein BWX54_00375 [Verrucomicrobia bacterium ADurb.Bin018]HOE00745.1 hypothetical protein [Kiritimatiellia bacterium]HOE36529.1 hypothetical protein [Kiritimatiellia bacterium]HOR74508.1 hypothetical protein [Kiritimatiellia bacterium]
MELALPDPITNYNRQIARQRYLRRAEQVLGHHPGFNLAYWRRIVRASDRVDRLGRHWGWSADQVKLTKALLITRMACVFIDHLIQRMKQAGIIPPHPDEPHLEWERQYRNFLLMFLRTPEIKDRREIVKNMQRLHRYTTPPVSLLEFRQRHWRWFAALMPSLLASPNPNTLFIRRQLHLDGPPVAAARRICFTAALYSDIQERAYRQQWMYAYSDCMLRLYDRLRATPQVLAAIIALD